MNLRNKKKLAADIMKIGVSRVRVDPEQQEDVSKAITRDDVRHQIATGARTEEEGAQKRRRTPRRNKRRQKTWKRSLDIKDPRHKRGAAEDEGR
jgi:ribosomal protein L19E